MDIAVLYYVIPVLIIAYGLYQLIISVFGFVPYQLHAHAPRHRLAILIAAHNEELVIGNLIVSLLKSNYPRSLYDIFVIADNCKDSTARIAKQAGAIVFARRHPDHGKGYAIQWGLEKIYQFGHYDAICFFDADNLVHPDFMANMNSELAEGKKVIQGYIESKNPFDTWVSATFTIAFWLMHRLFQRPRTFLGLSGALGGTGMCIATNVVQEIGWQATSLTEDMEFSALALLAGYPTHFSPPAIVYDEKATGFAQSIRQRLRWARGKFDVAFNVAPQFLMRFLKTRKMIYFDFLMLLAGPFILLFSFLYFLFAFAVSFSDYSVAVPISITHFMSLLGLTQYLLCLAVLAADRRSLRAYLWSIVYPVFIYTWIPITMWALLTCRDRQWSHTLHQRSISLEEVLKST